MSSMFEEYMEKSRAEGVIEGKFEVIKGMVDDGISLDKALKYANLDRETYETYKDCPADGADQ